MRRGNVRVLVLLALSFIIGFLLSAVVAGASVRCPPDISLGDKVNVAPIPFDALKDLVEENGEVFRDGKVTYFLTLAGEDVLTLDLPSTNGEPTRSIQGVFALVQGTNNGGPLSELECFFVGVPLDSAK